MSHLPPKLPDAALDQIFREARTAYAFRPEPIPEATLRELYDLLKWAPRHSMPNRRAMYLCKAPKPRPS